MQGVVYILTNKLNGMMYIGQTENLERRIKHHLNAAKRVGSRNEGQPIVHAIREFGIEAFYCAVLETVNADTKEELHALLDEREKFYITKYDTINKGYNITLGGRGMFGFIPSESARLAISKANKGKIISEAHKDAVRQATIKRWNDGEFRKFMSDKMSGEGNPMYGIRLVGELNHSFGKPKSEETKRKISVAKMGHPGHPMSDETKRKLTEAAKRPKSAEHRRKLSESLKGRELLDRRKPVIQYDKKGKFIKEWTGISEAEEALGIVHVSECVCGKRNYAGGFIWRFKSDSGDILPTPKNTRRIVQMDLNGKVIREFSSIKEASATLGICYSSVSAAVQGVQKKAGGFKFKYKD